MRAKNGESTVIESYNDFLAAKFQFSQELGHAVFRPAPDYVHVDTLGARVVRGSRY